MVFDKKFATRTEQKKRIYMYLMDVRQGNQKNSVWSFLSLSLVWVYIRISPHPNVPPPRETRTGSKAAVKMFYYYSTAIPADVVVF